MRHFRRLWLMLLRNSSACGMSAGATPSMTCSVCSSSSGGWIVRQRGLGRCSAEVAPPGRNASNPCSRGQGLLMACLMAPCLP